MKKIASISRVSSVTCVSLSWEIHQSLPFKSAKNVLIIWDEETIKSYLREPNNCEA